MKKILIGFLMAIALMLSISLANAAITVSGTYDSTHPMFGSASQVASNPDADDDAYQDVFVTKEITLLNSDLTATAKIDRIEVAPTSGFSVTDLNISITDSDKEIAANSSEPVTFQARIPETLDAVDTNYNAVAIKVAELKIYFLNVVDPTVVPVFMQRENLLTMKKAVFTSEENDKSYDSGDAGDVIEDIRPGEAISVEIQAKNGYSTNDNEDITIEDIDGSVLIDDDDFDVDEEESISDIDAQDTDSTTITFDVPNDIDEGTYDIVFSVNGEDEFGARHGQKVAMDLKVSRDKYVFEITKAELSNSEVSCSRSNSLSLKITSDGKSGDDEIAVYAKNVDLGINFKQEDIELDNYEGSDNDWSKTISFNVPAALRAGTYPILVDLYYSGTNAEGSDEGILAETKTVSLTVKNCVEETTPIIPEEDDSGVIIVDDEDEEGTVDVTPGNSNTEETATTTETSFFDTTAYVVILRAFVTIALIAIIFLVVKFLMI